MGYLWIFALSLSWHNNLIEDLASGGLARMNEQGWLVRLSGGCLLRIPLHRDHSHCGDGWGPGTVLNTIWADTWTNGLRKESGYPHNQIVQSGGLGLGFETRCVWWEAHNLNQSSLDLLDNNSARPFFPSTLLFSIVPGTLQIKKKKKMKGVSVQVISEEPWMIFSPSHGPWPWTLPISPTLQLSSSGPSKPCLISPSNQSTEQFLA